MNDAELMGLLADARRASRLQLLELLSTRIERLEADNATRDQIISMLKSWISARQKVALNKKVPRNEHLHCCNRSLVCPRLCGPGLVRIPPVQMLPGV
ncbi:hypothetical protein ACWUZV_05370 [Serratia marcescens]